MQDLKATIEAAFNDRQNLSPELASIHLRNAINSAIDLIDKGELRIAEKINSQWIVNEWAKKAVLLSFRVNNNFISDDGYTRYYDKVPAKFTNWSEHDFKHAGVRLVPPATVRKGAYLAHNTVIMPSFINIGAYIDTGVMIDTWATVGSCAQIGKNVHISGGVGIGGVLEPLQANPTIIEDNCFIGARSEIVEGVIVEEGSVISMGVFIGQSTPIYHRHTKKIYYGRVPAGSVVIPGNLPSADGSYSRYAAIIVKEVDERTRAKIPLNELLRIAEIE